MIYAIRHFGLYVKNYTESLHFYQDLGLETFYEKTEDWGFDFGELQIAKLKTKDEKVLELIFRKNDNDYIADKNSHVAFSVENLDLLYEKLQRQGVYFIVKPRLSPDKSAKVAFCFDPNGLRLELVEVLK
jgi:catechol 2,3-dioxygenase-like lactoylglutathione lyase family enzyme